MGGQALPVLPDTLEREEIEYTCRMIRSARTRGELGTRLAGEILDFTMFDLQVIGGTIREEIRRLPSPYREAVGAYLIEQIFGRHHQLITQFWNGEFEHLTAPIADRDLFVRFCDMIPGGCFNFTRNSETCLSMNRPRYRFFYYLITCYTMFVRDYPGHPVGMPFPGPFFVEEKNGIYFCPIRDKEKDVFYSICNFCPARQSEIPENR
jgi:uncharacterized protein (UPF0305 family)